MPGDTIAGRWKNEASSQPRASRFADPEVQQVNHEVEDELEPVLNKQDLLQGATKKESKFRNQEQLEEEDDEVDHDGDGEEQGQEGSERDLVY